MGEGVLKRKMQNAKRKTTMQMQNAECKIIGHGVRHFKRKVQNAKRKTSELRCDYKAVANNQSIVVNAFMRSPRQQTYRKQKTKIEK